MTFKILSEEQLSKIHCSSMHVLEKVGIEVPHGEILSRFSDFGAAVDMKKKRVKIPPDLVAKLVERAGKQFTLYGTDLNKTAEFGRGKRNYNSTAGQALWLDDLGQMRRYGNLDDLVRAVRFADALEFINIPGAMVDPHEFPIGWRCVAVLIEILKNTAKPVTFWFNDRRSAKYIVEILIALRGDEERASQYPLCYPFLEPISPLRFPYNGIDLLFETSRLNMPVPIGPMVQMGLSSPATISSTLTMENAEILAGICITQLVKPGVPVCYGGICHAFDMATTQIIFGGPEQAIFSAAMAQMGKYYGLPVYINAGLVDSKTVDA
jgi:trimethylamine--corrinoid protein Co-methyltransferase